MKRIYSILMLIAISVCAAVTVQASRYTWSRFNITFDVPDGGFVTFNSPSRLEIAWDDMSVSLQLYEKKGIDDTKIKKNLGASASDVNMFDTKVSKIKFSGFKGFYLTGSMPDGSFANICDLVSAKSDFMIQIEVNYLQGNGDAAMAVIKSITEGKKQQLDDEKPLKQKIQKKNAKPKPIKPTPAPGELYEV